MRQHEVGTRVGVILGADHGTKVMKILGYGTYEGALVPTADERASAGGMVAALGEAGRPNPKIRLDSGKVCWGCEVWWGPEDAVRAQVEKYTAAGFKIEDVDIDDERKAAAG